MKKIRTVILIALLTVGLLTVAGAEEYAISWYSVNSGSGDISGGDYNLSVSVGQSAAGFANSADFLHWTGFWSGEVPNPQVVAGIGAAKILPEGMFISISGNIATSAASDFDDFFYVENDRKTSGIRVAAPPGAIADLVRGSIVNVLGVLGVTSDGERQLMGPIVIVVGTDQPLNPVAMPNRSVGGSDFGLPPSGQLGVTDAFGINTIGLLIKTWGRVIGSGAGYVMIDDGSNSPVRMDTSTLATIPSESQYITVIGISSLRKSGSVRLRAVMPRGQSDVE
ncbi:MAG: hypothetical protein Q7T82_12790 [Armatimonadota bacterium]|nr:hypothetical protein [Armatimonadota bacterium]